MVSYKEIGYSIGYGIGVGAVTSIGKHATFLPFLQEGIEKLMDLNIIPIPFGATSLMFTKEKTMGNYAINGVVGGAAAGITHGGIEFIIDYLIR